MWIKIKLAKKIDISLLVKEAGEKTTFARNNGSLLTIWKFKIHMWFIVLARDTDLPEKSINWEVYQ